jgi:hypothetical protein
LPVDANGTEVVGVVRVPEPSAALTVMLGEEARLASEPPPEDFSCACHVCAPVEEVAVAPGPPLPVLPYVIVNVLPAERVSEATVSVWPETVSVPALEVVYPALAPVVDGALQPAGTTSVTDPLLIPPAAAV